MNQGVHSFQYIQIEPTTRCNFSCDFCAGRHLPQHDMTLDTFRSVIDLSENLRHVELQGEGEPTLNPHFAEMLAYLRRRRPEARISLITNGSLLTPSCVDAILDAEVSRVLVSVETSQADAFREIRGGALETVKRGISLVVSEKDKRAGATAAVGFAVTVLKRTVHHIHAIAELYDELGMDGGMIIQPLQRMETYSRFYGTQTLAEIPSPSDMHALRRHIRSDARLWRILGTPAARPGFYDDLFRSPRPTRRTCRWLESGLYIGAGGRAVTCCYIKDADQFELGMFHEANLPSIARKREELLETLLTGQTPDQCRQCLIAERITGHRRNLWDSR